MAFLTKTAAEKMGGSVVVSVVKTRREVCSVMAPMPTAVRASNSMVASMAETKSGLINNGPHGSSSESGLFRLFWSRWLRGSGTIGLGTT